VRKLLLLAVIASLTGCSTFGNMFGSNRKKDPVASNSPDPLMSPDIEEQQRVGRSRYAYPESNPNLVPDNAVSRPSPSGR
jgi:hypothetical protein